MIKFWLLTLLLALPGLLFAQPPQESIVGTWRFFEVEYQGERRPPFSPDLIITFEFNEDGTSRLHWTREGDQGFCERKARWEWDGETLSEEITWTNPENRIDCSSDPDMQMGRTTKTPTTIENGNLKTRLSLSGEPLYYIWKPLQEGE